MPTTLRRLKNDQRLLGTWKSDARRTLAEWSEKVSTAKQTALKSLFGRVELTYTRSKVIARLRQRGWEQSQHYVVLGTDSDSVAIAIFGELKIKDRKKY